MRHLLVVAAIAFALPSNATPLFIPLGDLPGGTFTSAARGVSADGSTVVGISTISDSAFGAFRWTPQSGMVGLGHLPGDLGNDATAASGDGSTIVGYAHLSGASQAFRWTASEGMVGLGPIGSGIAAGISEDGATIVGQSFSEAFRWTSGEGIVGLGYLALAHSRRRMVYAPKPA